MEVKKIALIVASIVVIGFVVALFTTGGWITDAIDQVWEWMWTSITGWFS